MTVIEYEYYQCAVCGAVSQHRSVLSTYHYGNQGWSDLDFRPLHEFGSSDYDNGFQTCPKCGYIARNIEEEVSDEIKSFVLSDEYKKLQSDMSTKEYLSLLALSQKKSDYDAMLTAARHLAWIYDDSVYYQEIRITGCRENNASAEILATNLELQKQSQEKALFYRRKALEILEKDEENLTINTDSKSCIIADLYRRCGDFEKAIEFCRETSCANESKREILRFEVYLSSQKDSSCHNIGDAKKYCAEHPEEAGITIPKTGNSWTCPRCGSEGNTGHYCPSCGTESWTCPSCHHKWNTGEVCENCQSPKPVKETENIKSWSCPACQHTGNNGKICRHCGKPKPELHTWDCPYCNQKGNTQEECSKCGFSYWDINDPMGVQWYEIVELRKIRDKLKEKDEG